jgi:Tol biopolymer transport system component
VSGILLLGSPSRFRRLSAPGRVPAAARRPSAVPGTGLVFAGLFGTQPLFGYPPGTPEGMATVITPASIAHVTGAALLFFGLVAATSILGRRWWRDGSRGWAGVSFCAGAVVLVGFGASGGGPSGQLLFPEVSGLLQRISLTAGLGWVLAVAVRNISRTRAHGVVRRPSSPEVEDWPTDRQWPRCGPCATAELVAMCDGHEDRTRSYGGRKPVNPPSGTGRFLALVLVVALTAACGPSPLPSREEPVTGDSSMSPTFDAQLSARLSQALETAVRDSGAPGAQAAVILADGSLWTGSAGHSTDDVSLTPDLLMAIGSITKVYTAALTLDLAHDGALSLDDPLDRWLPGTPNGDGVTIRQLLTHTSGLASDDPALARVCDPGTCRSYANSGYRLLGQIIENASGKDYAAALRERILSPLGLTATFYPRQEPATGESAMGHAGDENKRAVDVVNDDAPGLHGASGAIVATAADTARFVHALFTGLVLDADGLAELLDFAATRGLPGSDDCAAAGMVTRSQDADLGVSWGHGGNVGFFRSDVQHFPASGVTIAAIVNADIPAVGITGSLAEVALAEAPVVRSDVAGRCNLDIAVRATDGTVRQVTTDPDFDGMPSWSPDGTRIVWVVNHDGRNDIVVADIDGTHRAQLTDDAAQDVFPHWSPDGTAIAFSSNRDGDHEIYLMAPDGSDVRQVTSNGWDDFAPTWSPDGSKLAYVSMNGGQHIRVMSPDGSGDRVVTSGAGKEWWPAWSPDGRRIAYESGGVIFIVPVDGGDPVRLPIPQIRVTMFPAWAPSTDILFSSDGDLYSAAEDGTNLVRLTASSTEETTPAWGPDGSSIAFQLGHWDEVAR